MKKSKAAEREATAWNARVGVGDEIEYREREGAEAERLTTRTAAEVLSGHTAVVWLNGKRGCVAVSHCKA